MNLKGIDVSKHQGIIDWGKVSRTGIQFAMIRASYGSSGRDSTFSANVKGAQANGIETGAYHYSYAENTAQIRAEANNFLTAVKGYKLTYPLALDLEYNTNTAKAAGKWSDMAVTFLRILEDEGYFAMLYSDKFSLETRFDAKKIAPFAVWAAQWAKKNTYKGPYGIWQTTNAGKVPGITGPVDADISYVDYARIIRRAGLNQL